MKTTRLSMKRYKVINDVDFTHFQEKQTDTHIHSCIVVSGLASHPFGSWKARGGQFMWLRDADNWRTAGVRVLLYGYNTTLLDSQSFQNVDDIGGELGRRLSEIRTFRQVQYLCGGLISTTFVQHLYCVANLD